jgi:hypothetical protein
VQNFPGLTLTDVRVLNGFGLIPPDTTGAAGPHHFMELINGAFAVFDKASGNLITETSDATFWANAGVTPAGTGLARISDPRVLFDPVSQRWFAAAIDLGSPGNNFFVISIPKADLLRPTPTADDRTYFDTMDPAVRGLTLQPVSNFGSATDHGVIFSTDVSEPGNVIKLTDVLNPDTDSPSLSATFDIAVPSYHSPNNARQPDGTQDLDARRKTQQSSIFQVGNTIWAAQHIDVGGSIGIRWYEIDEPTHTIVQSGTISDPHHDYIYPSIAADELGDVVLGFTRTGDSTTDEFPSAFVVTGRTTGGVTTFGMPILLQAGETAYHLGVTRNRWGDYSETTRDPNDPRGFWTIQEFSGNLDDLGRNVWATQIAEISFDADARPSSAVSSPAPIGALAVTNSRTSSPAFRSTALLVEFKAAILQPLLDVGTAVVQGSEPRLFPQDANPQEPTSSVPPSISSRAAGISEIGGSTKHQSLQADNFHAISLLRKPDSAAQANLDNALLAGIWDL